MTITNNQDQSSDVKCCIDYCETTFDVSGQEVTNAYKCNQRPFASADLWSIQKQMRQSSSVLNKNLL
jgi:hypothetical protein